MNCAIIAHTNDFQWRFIKPTQDRSRQNCSRQFELRACPFVAVSALFFSPAETATNDASLPPGGASWAEPWRGKAVAPRLG